MRYRSCITAVHFLRGLALLGFRSVRMGAVAILRGFWKSYYVVSLRPTHELHDVTLPIDHRIPFDPKALRTYLGFYFPLVAFVGYVFRQRGRACLLSVGQLLQDLARLYSDAGLVFSRAQTSFKRTGSGFSVGLLRLVDKEKKSAPSVHVVVAAFTYCRSIELLQEFELTDFERVDAELKQAAARIIDATLLIKQHCVQDVALGLALVAFRYPTYIPSLHVLIDTIFAYSAVGLPSEVGEEVRSVIRKLFMERVRATGGIADMEAYLAALPLRKNMAGQIYM